MKKEECIPGVITFNIYWLHYIYVIYINKNIIKYYVQSEDISFISGCKLQDFLMYNERDLLITDIFT